ncbi:MAG: hypothetical protein ACLFS8_06540, partial [Clostridia bacterium]
MRWGLGPILVPAYFVLFLYAINADQLGSSVLPVPLAVALLSGLLVHALARRLLGRAHAAAPWSVLFWLAFLSFGWLQGALEGVGLSAPVSAASWFLLWGAVLWCSGHLLKNTRRDLDAVARFIDVSMVTLLVLVVGSMFVGGDLAPPDRGKYDLPAPDVTAPEPGRMPGDAPDVYYLVLDGYAREDVLRDLFQYDDTPFLGQLG